MGGAANGHTHGPCPSSRGRVVEFCACKYSTMSMVGPTSRDQHFAIGEQSRRVEQPTIIETACDRPSSRSRIVKFRARESGVWKSLRTWSRTACDQHPAIGEQCGRVIIPGIIEAAGKLPLKGSSGTRLHHRRT